MEIPNNVTTHEMRTSILYFDADGILYSTPKKNAPLVSTNEEIIDDVNKLRMLIGDKKVCMIIESDPNRPSPSKEQRDLISEQLNSIIQAMAIITTSPVSKMIVNLFFALKPPAYPTKMFSNEKEAKEWIMEICKTG